MAKVLLELPGLHARKRLVRAQAATNPRFGKAPKDRTAEELLHAGVVNLDKPSGPTSHQVAAWVSGVVGVSPVGHGGTLDPHVTGVLPTALGDATKGIQALLVSGKEYLAVLRLHADVAAPKIREAARSLVGRVKQLPPVRSAVARRVRQREIYYVEVLEVEGRDVLFRVGCEAGTYVRNLCIDLAKRVGTRGHMQQLRRTRTGPFAIEDAVTLQDLKDALVRWREEGDESELRRVVHPMESLFTHLPKIVVRDSAIGAVCHGAPLALPGITELDADITKGQPVLIESLKGEAVALAHADLDGRTMKERGDGVAARPERVLMPKDSYPKVWKRD